MATFGAPTRSPGGEIAAEQERDAEGREVAGADGVEPGAHVLVVLRLVALDEDGGHVLVAGDDGDLAVGGGLDSGYRGHALLHVVDKTADALGTVAGKRGLEAEAQQVLAAEAEIHVLQVVQGAGEQGGADQH